MFIHVHTQVDGDLNAARLRLADERIGAHALASSSSEESMSSYGGSRGRTHHQSVHDEAARAMSEAYQGSDMLDRERQNENRSVALRVF
jgi:hypothetical protein